MNEDTPYQNHNILGQNQFADEHEHDSGPNYVNAVQQRVSERMDRPPRAGSINATRADMGMQKADDLSPITMQMDALNRSINRLDNVTQQLVDRLAPIMGPDRTEPSGMKPMMDPEDQSALTGALQGRAYAIDEISSLISRTIDRLEV